VTDVLGEATLTFGPTGLPAEDRLGAVQGGLLSLSQAAGDRAAQLGCDAVEYYRRGLLVAASAGLLPGYSVPNTAEELRTAADPTAHLLDPAQRWTHAVSPTRGKGGKLAQQGPIRLRPSTRAQLEALRERQARADADADAGGEADAERAVARTAEESLDVLLAAAEGEGEE
jgi:hypothetical protein